MSGMMQAAQSAQGERTPGIHVSDIIRTIMMTLEPKRFAAQNKDKPPVERMAPGVIWEQLLEDAMSKLAVADKSMHLVRPGEVVQDGIILTPDAISITEWLVHEFKFTWMSSNGAIDHKKFFHWMLQLKAYCYALKTRQARLHAFFVMGDYAGSGPQTLAWNVKFTQLELDETWQMLLNTARSKGWMP